MGFIFRVPVAVSQYHWISTIGNIYADQAWGVDTDTQNNVYVGFHDNDDIILTKYNSAGAVQWCKRICGPFGDQVFGVTSTPTGVAITGSTAAGEFGSTDTFIASFSTAGNPTWQLVLGGSAFDTGRSVVSDTTGNIFVVGATQSQGAGSNDIVITKLTSSGTVVWQRAIGGVGTDFGYDIDVDATGNVYVIGYTSNQGAGNNDILIVKYDSDGALLWQRALGGSSPDVGYGGAVDAQGNVYVCAIVSSQGQGSSDLVVAKYNTTGALQWQKAIGTTTADAGYGLSVDGSGNVYAVGTTQGQGAGGTDALIVKYDSQGTMLWQRTLGSSGTDVLYRVTVDASGAVCAVGYGGTDVSDALVVKLPADGSKTGTYGNFVYQNATLTETTTTLTETTTTLSVGTANKVAYDVPINSSNEVGLLLTVPTGAATGTYDSSVGVDSSGNMYLAFHSSTQGAGGNDFFVSKFDSTGTLQWQRALGSTTTEQTVAIATSPSGNVYITGYTSTTTGDVVVAKFNSSGTLQWQKLLGNASRSDGGYSIAIDTSENVYVSGYSNNSGTTSVDVLTVKYNSSGVLQWYRTLGGAGTDGGFAVDVDTSGNVYTVGYAVAQGAGLDDALIVKYDSTGSLVWQRALGGTNTDRAQSVGIDATGNVYVGGYTNSQGPGTANGFIAKYNSSGTLQWQRTFGVAGVTIARVSIHVTSSGSVYAIGSNTLLVYDTNGTLVSQHVLPLAHTQNPAGIVADSTYLYVGYTPSQILRISTALQYLYPATFTSTTSTLTSTVTTYANTTLTLTDATGSFTVTNTTVPTASYPIYEGMMVNTQSL